MTKSRANKRAAPAEIDDDAPEAEYLPPDAAFDEKISELRAGGDGEIRVYREGPGGYRDLTFVQAFNLDEFEPSILQAAPFNGGRFRLHVRGQNGLKANFLFKVEPLPGTRPNDAGGGINLTMPPSDFGGILAAMNAGFEKMFAVLQKTQGGSVASEALKLVELMERMRPVSAAAPSGLGGVTQIAELLRAVDDIRGGGEGGGGSLGILARALEKFAEPLGAVVSKIAEQRLGGVASAPALTAPADATQEGTMQDLITQYAPLVLAQARANKDPAPMAALIVENVDGATVAEFLNSPQWWEQIVSALPGSDILQLRGWFEELREETLTMLADDAPPLTPEAPQADTSGHAATDKPGT